ncbi:DUF4153 domain-containing protein [uncultured Pelagimonas sp.]|uniref:DUF4153 domain-containing protein n=1 Tax=uncultured Pelagimonas sp. TaxID=1618102 RepID=UPI00260D2326|nr:DUF4173 domain-containing protein [uncultured Pelagimonas sp.]
MTPTFERRGLPNALARDAWWFSDDQTPPPPDTDHERRDTALPKSLALLLVVALADRLFWEVEVGISLALFTIALFFVATADIRPRSRLVRPAILLLIGSLPIIEYVQLLSCLFLVLSFALALVWARSETPSSLDMIEGVWTLFASYFEKVARSLVYAVQLKTLSPTPNLAQILRSWGFPVGGALVFGGLLLMANPILLQAISIDIQFGDLMARGMFWLGVAVLFAPFLVADTTIVPMPNVRVSAEIREANLFGLTKTSCLRALWMFNTVIGVQTAMDLGIFVGGASLPDSMSYASYAHRGSYPLLATALLAGGFALLARPFLGEHRALKPLMYLWLAQNILLCLSAMLRLDLYVGAYGLTYLRIYAMIWIGLVAVGLTLVAWQARCDKTNVWLFTRWGGLATAVLFTCCFVNFADHIVHQNLTMAKPDFDYICTLNPTARGALGHPDANGLPSYCPINRLNTLDNWQEWGFRNWRSGLYDNSNQVLAEKLK